MLHAKNSYAVASGISHMIHVADQLIQAGYRVRGTSRDTTKTAWITEMFDKRYGEGKFEAVVVKDMAESGAFDEACKGVSGVAHVASVLTFDSDPNKVIPTVVNGAVNAATSAAKQTSVKRFVYTSSSTAITAPRPNVEITISTENWNNEDVKAAWEPPPFEAKGAWSPYGASKTQAEQEMWKFVKEHEPGFVLNAVLPNTNMGEILSDKRPASSGGWVRSVYNRNLNAVKDVPPQWMVNVKDTARLHVAALLDPEVENERILAFAHPYNWNDVLAVLRKIHPDKNFPTDVEDEPRRFKQVG
ncbi:hypothetical protein HO133_006148 [Letharia lupina]|uniref:NAD-dependent epimerase/dehydratase domain-containing protein n=1 Tax=Letharia lupina TaxID=560253 RepID=A0A8H6C756_9LECA|nr:uncharacterized protein HO133_006148 [Letharia lupina]KAF6218188.1 hypothetical protein HO133_006148 [Letharia lupina]